LRFSKKNQKLAFGGRRKGDIPQKEGTTRSHKKPGGGKNLQVLKKIKILAGSTPFLRFSKKKSVTAFWCKEKGGHASERRGHA
jgi:hypothetical protein